MRTSVVQSAGVYANFRFFFRAVTSDSDLPIFQTGLPRSHNSDGMFLLLGKYNVRFRRNWPLVFLGMNRFLASYTLIGLYTTHHYVAATTIVVKTRSFT